MRARLGEPMSVSGLGITVDGAVGIVVAPDDGLDAEELLARAVVDAAAAVAAAADAAEKAKAKHADAKAKAAVVAAAPVEAPAEADETAETAPEA